MPFELGEQISQLGHGDHVCMVYENRADQIAGAVPFIRQGLERNEYCLYVADDRTVADVREELENSGVDVAAEIARGALALVTKREAYLRSEPFDPTEMVAFLEAAVERALGQGFAGFRVTGEMTWALGVEHGCERLIEYEALLNTFFPGSKALAICQYNRERFAPEVIQDVLRTHPQAVVGRYVCTNLYYEPPDLMLQKTSAKQRVDWMLRQLQKAREAEMAMKYFNARLEAKVAEKTLSLEEARGQLQTFCHTMAHDLRAPLRSIQGYAAAMIEEHREELAGPAKSYVERMQKAAARMDRLISDLLTYASMMEKELVFEAIDVPQLLEFARAEFIELHRALGVTVELRACDGCVVGHRMSLQLALANLLNNAAKFVAPGTAPRIILSAEERGAHIALQVADNGVGIPAEDQSRLFRPFERLHKGLSVDGTGMGLAIVRKSVERMSGSVGVESKPGKGSRFTIELKKADTGTDALYPARQV